MLNRVFGMRFSLISTNVEVVEAGCQLRETGMTPAEKSGLDTPQPCDHSGEPPASSRSGLKVGLLILLGFLWSFRIVAIKEASLAGISTQVTVSASIIGMAIVFSTIALIRASWPPLDRATITFYIIDGILGFVMPFILEGVVAPRLPVFVFVVIISTMPVITLALAAATGTERVTAIKLLTIGLGFCVALLVAFDTGFSGSVPHFDWVFLLPAFGVPVFYAANTVFVASRWPKSADAIHVGQAQALVLSVAALLGFAVSGSLGELAEVGRNIPAVMSISLGEGVALLIYLKIIRDFGATTVAFANYISLVFAAVLGGLLFGDRLTWLSAAAALLLMLALSIPSLHAKLRGRIDASSA
ncbi:drug/metabolite transporter (DMT)-like permease [Rhizobium aquaticum]|uniref:Drug/metabolite transporter (DMT)-like permease n=1 Tax=Rhizobium aquaticum TaxID=1549636 RepID=A0ABV2IVJ1_9HYPH